MHLAFKNYFCTNRIVEKTNNLASINQRHATIRLAVFVNDIVCNLIVILTKLHRKEICKKNYNRYRIKSNLMNRLVLYERRVALVVKNIFHLLGH